MTKERQYQIVTGLERLWFSENVKNTRTVKEYKPALALENAVNFGVSPEGEPEPVYGSNQVVAMLHNKQGGSISVEMNDLQRDLDLMISGAKVNQNGHVIKSEDDISPYVGVIAEFTRHDGTKKYVGLPMVIFGPAANEANTRQGASEAQSITIEGVVHQSKFHDGFSIEAFSDDLNFSLENFFNDVFGDAEVEGGTGNEDNGGNGDNGGDGGNTGGNEGYDENGIPYAGGVGLYDGAMYDDNGNAVLSPEEVEDYTFKLDQEVMPYGLRNFQYDPVTGDIWTVDYSTDGEGNRTQEDVLRGVVFIPGDFTKWYEHGPSDYSVVSDDIPPYVPGI